MKPVLSNSKLSDSEKTKLLQINGVTAKQAEQNTSI